MYSTTNNIQEYNMYIIWCAGFDVTKLSAPLIFTPTVAGEQSGNVSAGNISRRHAATQYCANIISDMRQYCCQQTLPRVWLLLRMCVHASVLCLVL